MIISELSIVVIFYRQQKRKIRTLGSRGKRKMTKDLGRTETKQKVRGGQRDTCTV